MALFGLFHSINPQLAADARFVAAHRYVADMLDLQSAARYRIGRAAAGTSERIELAGGAYAIEQVYVTKPRSEGFFESHQKYIDVQVVVEGEELMEAVDTSRLTVAEPYNAERDFIKYADTAEASVLRFRSGDAAIFFPADGHMPSLRIGGPVLVRKIVVKVPVFPALPGKRI